MRKVIGLVMLVGSGLLGGVSAAAAQNVPAVEGPAQPVPERKSPGRALFYSFANTAVPVLLATEAGAAGATALAVYGAVAGPAAGHAYAGNRRQAWRGIALRAVGVGAGIGGSVLAIGGSGLGGDPAGADAALGVGLVVVSAVGVTASIVNDVATAPASARAYNAAHGLSVVRRLAPDAPGLTVRLVW